MRFLKHSLFCVLAFVCVNISVVAADSDFSLRDLGNGTAEITAYSGGETALRIPETVAGKRIVSVGKGAFAGHATLQSVAFPQSVISIGDCAFLNCSALKSVTLPDSLRSLGEEAFALCSSLEKISAPKFIASLGENAFPLSSKKLYPENRFPALEFVSDSLVFSDPSGDSAIDGLEACTLRVTVVNTGDADAYGCRLKIALKEPNPALTFPLALGIPHVPAGKSLVLEIPISASRALKNGSADFTFSVEEPNGFGTNPHNLVVETRPFTAPHLKIVDFAVSGQGDSVLKKNRPFDLQLFLQNTMAGTAENVEVSVEFPSGVFITDGETKRSFAKLSGGEAKPLEYSLMVPRRYRKNEIPVKVKISEKHGEYAENWETTLTLNSAIATSKTEINAKAVTLSPGIEIASFRSEVDKDIPVNPESSRNRFVAIIANETYHHGTASVDFALNDGKTFKEYCLKTLGVPENQIKLYTNATSGSMGDALTWLARRGRATDAELIFYYSGHGIPDEATKKAYLLPTDTSPANLNYALPLTKVYSELGNSGAKLATVFIDACFSGMRRDSKPIVAAKGVRIASRLKDGDALPENLVVFTAASGDQTAHFAREEKHGLFTYVLLKKLKESRGNVSLSELRAHLPQAVFDQSLKLSDYEQEPSVLADDAFPLWDEKLYAPDAK